MQKLFRFQCRPFFYTCSFQLCNLNNNGIRESTTEKYLELVGTCSLSFLVSRGDVATVRSHTLFALSLFLSQRRLNTLLGRMSFSGSNDMQYVPRLVMIILWLASIP